MSDRIQQKIRGIEHLIIHKERDGWLAYWREHVTGVWWSVGVGPAPGRGRPSPPGTPPATGRRRTSAWGCATPFAPSPSQTYTGNKITVHTQYSYALCTAKFETNIPRKGRNCAASFHIHVSLTIYIFPESVCLFCCRKYVNRSWEDINRSQTHECGNWDWGRAIPRKRIYKWYFRCSVWVKFCYCLVFAFSEFF